ncbi:MAG TPA: GNAT family N-acetyltransferase [Desulfobacterales bacterium]|nr:GNAT family N-acetyltransferase [Desulfobacterales bacterium]
MLRPDLKFKWLERLSEVQREAWNALALPLETPFLEWDWLQLMEASGSTGAETGWIPRHLTVWSGRELVAAAPLYVKTHSAGEFVFDHAWADVAGRLNRPYYPKLVGMTPFTPMIGYRFLMAPGLDEVDLTARMLEEIERFCRYHGLAGSSYNFVDPQWAERIAGRGFCPWAHQSFVWENEGFSDFEDYLSGFNANQRRNIRRERRRLAQRGIRVDMISGDDLPAELYERMHLFYAWTNDQFGPWGCKYLTENFFGLLSDRFRGRLVFAVASDDTRRGPPVGMALLVAKGNNLYGRYWGCAREVEFLHFEACYYRPIEWAIGGGIRRFDPGMGGGHKLRRGFKAVPNFSLHRFMDPVLRQIMEKHIAAINRLEHEEIAALNRHLPLRNLTEAGVAK